VFSWEDNGSHKGRQTAAFSVIVHKTKKPKTSMRDMFVLGLATDKLSWFYEEQGKGTAETCRGGRVGRGWIQRLHDFVRNRGRG
jgi:hypothetical protein